MPKGSVRKPMTVKTKTWSGAKLERTPTQLKARTKNMLRENFPTASQYREDVKAAAARKDVRSDASVKRVRKIIKAPVGKGGK